jgi:hypothetical protein
VGLGGGPLPGEALPDAHSSNTAPLLLQLESGDFHPEDYISFGYTHYEAWCIGGVGGYGGNEVSGIHWDTVVTRPRMSSGDWSKYLELMRLYNNELSPPPTYTSNHPGPGGVVVEITMEQWYEEQFPNHDPLNLTVFSNPTLAGDPSAFGGGGGGGGLMIVGGLLADLPQPTPVVVGAVGADGANGQAVVEPPGIWTPIPQPLTEFWPTTETRMKVLNNYFRDFMFKYPLPHPGFTGGPMPGGDGGASSFGDVCRASGGKGGGPSTIWTGGHPIVTGAGGEGGVGDQVIAGGGAAGALGPASSPADGSNGSFDPVETIGQGGGGGRGGAPGHIQWVDTIGGPSLQTVGDKFSGRGGRGSYSFADTSVWGPPGVALGRDSTGGSGGGAHYGSGKKFGAYAPGYLPEGVVLLRVYKV